jgi:hypothetical protein
MAMAGKIIIPCKDCLILGICKGIANDGIKQLNIFEEIINYVDTVFKSPSMAYKSFLTQESINTIVQKLVGRCSLLFSYIDDAENQDESYWNIRNFFNLNQGEWK